MSPLFGEGPLNEYEYIFEDSKAYESPMTASYNMAQPFQVKHIKTKLLREFRKTKTKVISDDEIINFSVRFVGLEKRRVVFPHEKDFELKLQKEADAQQMLGNLMELPFSDQGPEKIFDLRDYEVDDDVDAVPNKLGAATRKILRRLQLATVKGTKAIGSQFVEGLKRWSYTQHLLNNSVLSGILKKDT